MIILIRTIQVTIHIKIILTIMQINAIQLMKIIKVELSQNLPLSPNLGILCYKCFYKIFGSFPNFVGLQWSEIQFYYRVLDDRLSLHILLKPRSIHSPMDFTPYFSVPFMRRLTPATFLSASDIMKSRASLQSFTVSGISMHPSPI